MQKCGMAKLDNDDSKTIKDLMEVVIEEAVERKPLVTKDNIGNLPTEDQFYGAMDKVMGEMKAIREEVVILGHQLSEHTDRLDRMESNQDTSSN